MIPYPHEVLGGLWPWVGPLLAWAAVVISLVLTGLGVRAAWKGDAEWQTQAKIQQDQERRARERFLAQQQLQEDLSKVRGRLF